MTAALLHDAIGIERTGAVTTLTITHPPANAISGAVVAGIREGLDQAQADPDCHAIILTGDGDRFFAAGADITEFASNSGEAIATGQNITTDIEASPLPVIAAINGYCFGGGCELALACDIRIASSNAKLGQPEIKLGIIPGWGGTQRLPRIIGLGPAMELLLTGDPVDAARALELGLVSAVVEPGQLRSTALELAQRLAGQAPLAVAATKQSVYRGFDLPLHDALNIERGEFSKVFTSEDAREGVSAFLEKRKPSWSGR
jgi:enoyl-CoA hydratase